MGTSLPTNIAATYPDQSPGDATHQQHHDAIHSYTNSHDTAADPHGDRADAAAKVAAHEAAADPHPQYRTASMLIWGERNGVAAVGSTYAFGNGANSVSHDIAIPVTCTLTAVTLACDDATSTVTVTVFRNGVATTAAVSVAATRVAVASASVAFAAGDRLHFEVTSGTANTGSVVAAHLTD